MGLTGSEPSRVQSMTCLCPPKRELAAAASQRPYSPCRAQWGRVPARPAWSHLQHLPGQLPILHLLAQVCLCQLQPLHMVGAPIVKVVAMPQLAARTAPALKGQRGACGGGARRGINRS